MSETIAAILPELWVATGQTFLMLAIGLSAAILIGGPLGVLLFLLGPGQSLENKPAFVVLNWLVNTVRSFPFIILTLGLFYLLINGLILWLADAFLDQLAVDGCLPAILGGLVIGVFNWVVRAAFAKD